MLIFSALLSILLVTFIYYSHRKLGSPVLMSFVFAGSSAVLVCLMPTLFFHSILVFLGALVWKTNRWGSTSFLVYMGLAAIVPYGFFAYLVFEDLSENRRLRDQYAFESMEDRVPTPKIASRTKPSKEMESHLTRLEGELKGGEEDSFRAYMLQQLHEESVHTFINSPGFGQIRSIRPAKWSLEMNVRRDENPIPQPDAPPQSTLTEGDLLTEPNNIRPDALREMHITSILDFVNPQGFGWIVNRQKAAGFRPHHFSRVPNAKEWKVQTVELLGILLHEQPVVYISNELPSMDKLRKVPTRSLNAFESAGLQKMQEGENMLIRETSEGVRMLGAVRSIEQCVKCHGGERGDLLGAFTYSLRRSTDEAGR